MSVKERLKYYIDYRGISIRSFESETGLSNGYVNNITNSISPSKQILIKKAFPDLSIPWLLTGEGDMLRSNKNYLGTLLSVYSENPLGIIYRMYLYGFKNRNAPFDKIDAPLRAVLSMITPETFNELSNGIDAIELVAENFKKKNPDVNLDWLINGQGEMMEKDTLQIESSDSVVGNSTGVSDGSTSDESREDMVSLQKLLIESLSFQVAALQAENEELRKGANGMHSESRTKPT